MGLNEKRAVEEFRAKEYPAFVKNLKDTLGFEINVETNWESLMKAVDGRPKEAFSDYFLSVFAKPVIEALKNICIDDLGREALKSRIKLIIIRNQTNYDGRLNVTIEGDSLCLDGQYYADLGMPSREQMILELLEQNL